MDEREADDSQKRGLLETTCDCGCGEPLFTTSVWAIWHGEEPQLGFSSRGCLVNYIAKHPDIEDAN